MREMNGMTLMKAIGPMIKTRMKAIGPLMICTILMSMDISREKEKEKEKERKERKARMKMAKEENQEMAKVSPTMFNLTDLIDSSHTKPTAATSPLFFCGIKFWSWILCICRD